MTLTYPLLWNPEDDEYLSEEEREDLQARLLETDLFDSVDPETCPELAALLHSLEEQ
jgi:hypothetical protein